MGLFSGLLYATGSILLTLGIVWALMIRRDHSIRYAKDAIVPKGVQAIFTSERDWKKVKSRFRRPVNQLRALWHRYSGRRDPPHAAQTEKTDQ